MLKYAVSLVGLLGLTLMGVAIGSGLAEDELHDYTRGASVIAVDVASGYDFWGEWSGDSLKDSTLVSERTTGFQDGFLGPFSTRELAIDHADVLIRGQVTAITRPFFNGGGGEYPLYHVDDDDYVPPMIYTGVVLSGVEVLGGDAHSLEQADARRGNRVMLAIVGGEAVVSVSPEQAETLEWWDTDDTALHEIYNRRDIDLEERGRLAHELEASGTMPRFLRTEAAISQQPFDEFIVGSEVMVLLRVAELPNGGVHLFPAAMGESVWTLGEDGNAIRTRPDQHANIPGLGEVKGRVTDNVSDLLDAVAARRPDLVELGSEPVERLRNRR